MGVQSLRELLYASAERALALKDERSRKVFETIAEEFGEAKRRSRVRRDKWRERASARETEEAVSDGINRCRVEGCGKDAGWRPTLVLAPEDEGAEPIKVETVMLDVCEFHARNLGPEAYTGTPSVWGAIVRTWTDNGLPAPEAEDVIEVQYLPVNIPRPAHA